MTDEYRLLATKLGIQCYNSFYKFFLTFWPEMSGEQYHDNWHIRYICDVLQEKAEKLLRLEDMLETVVINVPPGSSKSTIATIAFPIWVWVRNPSFSTTNISYAAEVSKSHSNKARAIIDSEKFEFIFRDLFKVKHGKPLKIIKDAERKMTNNFGGDRFNTSVGGSITGMHANILIEDDPLNPKEAFSDAERQSANTFHDDTVSSRKKNFRSYLNIIIAQRIHEEDTCGHVLKQKKKITHICLPSEITPTSPVIPEECKKFYIDGVLDPVRKPKFVLQDMQNSMSSVGYSGQFLQQPFNLEEQPIKPSMFELVDERDDIVFDLFVDGAYTDKTENDPSGLMVAGHKDGKLYVKDVYNVYKTLPDLLKFIKELADAGIFNKDKGRIFIEPKASGYSLAQYIEEETDFNYVLIGQNTNKGEKNIVSQGKTVRHGLIQPKAESKRIKLFKGEWNKDYIHQLCGFPRAAHDEQVDNTGYAVHTYFMKENSFIKDYAIKRLEKEITGGVSNVLSTVEQNGKLIPEMKENNSGDVVVYLDPQPLYKYRYITVLTVKNETGRDESNISVYDRMDAMIVAQCNLSGKTTTEVAKKALGLSMIYGNARLVVAVEKSGTNTETEESDLSHLILNELRKYRYQNLYIRLTINQVAQSREREFGFLLNTSSKREIFYNIKDMVEHDKIKEMPRIQFEQLKTLTKDKETGEVGVSVGMSDAALLSLAISLKVDAEIREKPITRKVAKW